MLVVKTELRPSPIHGIGVFLLEDVAKERPVWIFDNTYTIDVVLPKKNFNKLYLPEDVKNSLKSHFWEEGDFYFASLDNTNYLNTNKLEDVTMVEFKDLFFAARDLKEGEELTCYYPLDPSIDYRSKLYEAAAKKFSRYLEFRDLARGVFRDDQGSLDET